MTYLDLTTIGYELARRELRESKDRLEEVLHALVAVAAYPFGRASSETRQASRDAGFRFGCRADGAGDWNDPYDLPRESLGNRSTVLSLRLMRHPRLHRLARSGR